MQQISRRVTFTATGISTIWPILICPSPWDIAHLRNTWTAFSNSTTESVPLECGRCVSFFFPFCSESMLDFEPVTAYRCLVAWLFAANADDRVLPRIMMKRTRIARRVSKDLAIARHVLEHADNFLRASMFSIREALASGQVG